MSPWRRSVSLAFAALLFLLAGGMSYVLLTAQRSSELKPTFAGFAMLMGALGLLIVLRCLDWRHPQELAPVNDANATVDLSVSQAGRRSIMFSLLLMAVGFCFWAFGALGQFPFILCAVAGWAGLIGCGCALVSMLRGKYPTSLQLSPQGLSFSGFEVGTIDWKDIRAARLILFAGKIHMIALELENEDKYLSRRPRSLWRAVERAWVSSSFMFAPPVIELSAETILKAIDIRRSAFGRAGSQPV